MRQRARRLQGGSRASTLRVGWGFVDQALSSGTNFGLIVMVARALDPRAFGSFAVAMALYLIVLGSSRGLNTDALVIRFSGTEPENQRAAISAAAGSALWTGAVAGAAFYGVGVLMAPDLARVLLPLGVSMPGLIVQDTWRYSFFTLGKPRAAVANDFLWAALQFGFIALLLARDNATATTLTLAWGAAATLAAVGGSAQLRLLPKPALAASWWRSHRDIGPRYMLQFWAMHGSTLLIGVGVGAVAGLEQTGILRGGQALFGPLTVLVVGTRLAVMSEGSRRTDRSESVGKLAKQASLVLGTIALTWGAALTALPDRVGRILLGRTWAGAETVILPLALWLIAVGVTEGAVSGLRVLAAAKRSLRVQLVMAPISLSAGLLGAATAGALGAAVGLAASGWIGAGYWWFSLRAERASAAEALGRHASESHSLHCLESP